MTYVYFLKGHLFMRGSARHAWKVGLAANVERRLRNLQTGCPFDLEVFGSLRCESAAQARDIEQRLHGLLDARRQRGEWFTLGAQDVIAIRSLIGAWPVGDLEAYWDQAKADARHLMNAAYATGTPVSSLQHPEVFSVVKKMLETAPHDFIRYRSQPRH